MAKGWTKIGDNGIDSVSSKTKEEKMKQTRRVNNMIRNEKSLNFEDLVKKSNESYDKMISEENRLIDLVDSGKLKNKNYVDKVKTIKAARQKKSKTSRSDSAVE